ncbi:strawberry notch family protein (plasmid) [Chelativorans sp. AA-79]|nr:strawberry notch family protein [Chelativorans sp. AA-79]WEX12468.1 strawberry notch family protein [Chelativorans sp. AA-79]
MLNWVDQEAWSGGAPTRTKKPFDGVIVFDEAHAMANAAGGKSERGDVSPSQQGRAGLRLQHALPNARVVYVSATGSKWRSLLARRSTKFFTGFVHTTCWMAEPPPSVGRANGTRSILRKFFWQFRIGHRQFRYCLPDQEAQCAA